MKVAAIDERDLHRRAPETTDGLKTAEASPQNDYAMPSTGVAHA